MQHFPYRSPLDRGFLAKLLPALDARHPRAVVLDYLFDQPTEPDKDDALRGGFARHEDAAGRELFRFRQHLVSADQTAYLNAFVLPDKRALANLGTDQTDTERWIVPGAKASNGEYLLSVPRRVVQIAGIQSPDARVPIVWRADEGANISPPSPKSRPVFRHRPTSACRSPPSCPKRHVQK